MSLTFTLLAGSVIASASLVGIVFTARNTSDFLHIYQHHLLAFSLGVISLALYSLFHESLEHFLEEGVSDVTASLYFLLGTFGGALLVYMGTRRHPHHHHAGAEHTHDHGHSCIDGRHILMGDAVHNIGDGIVLYSAFLVSPIVGIGTTIGVVVHEVVQEIAEFFVLKEAGYTTEKALLANGATSLTIFVGIGLAAFTASAAWLLPWLFAASCGAFLYVALFDIVPCVFGHQTNWRNYIPLICALLLGIAVMYSVGLFAGH